MTRLEFKIATLANRRTVLNSQIYTLEHKRDYNFSFFTDEDDTNLYYLHSELEDLSLTLDRLSK